ncbi:hypothetical protein HPB48_001000 [Haemaphysalis longicornis]|uniref:AMP-binding enzyme C-terminal domain-containing protein n=1 Tax=Haemaphysalis longicornis TaxID=44386 RepID=A0A9J6GZ14_HAELO|nr:hypothetical protein HPB48_001000 [Haemaphysalis longicornis]
MAGDLGYYNHDGRLFLVGRIKSTMFRLGKHINPSDIEQCLYGHPSVAEAAVLPLKRHDTDDDPAAIIVPKHGVVADGTLAEEIRTFVAGNYSILNTQILWTFVYKK